MSPVLAQYFCLLYCFNGPIILKWTGTFLILHCHAVEVKHQGKATPQCGGAPHSHAEEQRRYTSDTHALPLPMQNTSFITCFFLLCSSWCFLPPQCLSIQTPQSWAITAAASSRSRLHRNLMLLGALLWVVVSWCWGARGPFYEACQLLAFIFLTRWG